MYVFVVLHYCQRSMLCMSFLCCTTASTGCYVCLVRLALLPVQGAMYALFVLHYRQCRVPYMSCLCLHYCQRRVLLYVRLVCVALLPAQCAAVEYCQRSNPYGGFSFLFSYFYTFSLVGNGRVRGSSIITAGNLIFPVMYLGKKCQVLQSNIPQLSFFSSHPSILVAPI